MISVNWSATSKKEETMKLEANVSFHKPEGDVYGCDINIDKDYVEAKSLATVAYIVLGEAWKIATENAELIRKKNP